MLELHLIFLCSAGKIRWLHLVDVHREESEGGGVVGREEEGGAKQVEDKHRIECCAQSFAGGRDSLALG